MLVGSDVFRLSWHPVCLADIRGRTLNPDIVELLFHTTRGMLLGHNNGLYFAANLNYPHLLEIYTSYTV